jgi:hypothetical protein
VDGAHARMAALVPGQVDPRHRDAGRGERGFGDGLGAADEREHGPIVVGVHLEIEVAGAGDGLDRRGDFVRHLPAPSVAEVGNTFQNHGGGFYNLAR